jgi:pyridoxine 4-dehydrogenase
MHMPQFADRANFEHNLKLAHAVADIAGKKGVTKAQIAMAWVKAQSGRNGMPVIIPIPGATTEERIAENMADVTLSEQDLEEIAKIQKENPILGDRYGGPFAQLMNGGEHM